MHETNKHLFNSQEVANFCGVPLKTAEAWFQSNKLSGELNNGEMLTAAEDLVSFMQQNHLAVPPELEETDNDGTPSPGALSVVVIEAQKSSAKAITEVMENMRLRVVQHLDSPGMINIPLAQEPNLLTLDVGQNSQASFELIQQISQIKNRTTKILVISDAMPSLISRARLAGADAVIAKPIDFDTLKRATKILLGMT